MVKDGSFCRLVAVFWESLGRKSVEGLCISKKNGNFARLICAHCANKSDEEDTKDE